MPLSAFLGRRSKFFHKTCFLDCINIVKKQVVFFFVFFKICVLLVKTVLSSLSLELIVKKSYLVINSLYIRSMTFINFVLAF
jgi:hypothetical protein